MKYKLLLHTCCAPCFTTAYETIINSELRINTFNSNLDFDTTVFFHNPNITDKDEYNKRFDTLINYIEKKNYKLKVINTINQYNYADLYKGFENERECGYRCKLCYMKRLEDTFLYAKENNYDYVATTLTLSPLKPSVIINSIGNYLQNRFRINYVSSNFKKNDGYKKSIQISKLYNLYRQNFCGCDYSKKN